MVRLAAASLCVEFQSDVNTNYSVELWLADRASKPGLSDKNSTRFVILVSTNVASTEPRQIIPSPTEPRSVAASGCIFHVTTMVCKVNYRCSHGGRSVAKLYAAVNRGTHARSMPGPSSPTRGGERDD